MPYGDPWPSYPFGGPIWIDPNHFRYPRQPPFAWEQWETTTTTNIPARPAPVDEERIREIVRKEIADLPIPFDVPDAPPEA